MFRFLNRKKYDHTGFLVDQMRALSNELVSLNIEFYEGRINQDDYNKLCEAKTRLLLKRRRQYKYISIT
jgi:hypothetical protein